MTTTREQFEDRPELGQALNNWQPNAEGLSSGEAALTSTVHALVEHFDRLDGPHQQAIVAALAAVAEETVTLEAPIRRAHAAALRRPERFTLAEYRAVHGIADDVGTPGDGLFATGLHDIPQRGGSKHQHIRLHGPMGGPGNLIVVDKNQVWLYREEIEIQEAREIIQEGITHAKNQGRAFEHTDMLADFSLDEPLRDD